MIFLKLLNIQPLTRCHHNYKFAWYSSWHCMHSNLKLKVKLTDNLASLSCVSFSWISSWLIFSLNNFSWSLSIWLGCRNSRPSRLALQPETQPQRRISCIFCRDYLLYVLPAWMPSFFWMTKLPAGGAVKVKLITATPCEKSLISLSSQHVESCTRNVKLGWI